MTMCAAVFVFGLVLFTSPIDAAQRIQETLIGEKTEIECDSTISRESLTWQHKRIGPRTYHAVYEDGKYSAQYSERYSVKPSTNALVINDVQIDDAGTYRCKDNNDERKDKQTELITLETSPICNSSFDSRLVVAENSCGFRPDKLAITCSIRYQGNVQPTLQWDGFEDEQCRQTNSSNRVLNTLTTVAKWNQVVFSCQTGLTHLKCFFVMNRPTYIFNETTNITLNWPQSVTCSSNTSGTCSYKWLKDIEEVSQTQILQLTEASSIGVYTCVANCSVNGRYCNVQPTTVMYEYLPSNPESHNEERADGYNSYYIIWNVVSSVLAIGISIVCYVCYTRKFYNIRVLMKRIVRWINRKHIFSSKKTVGGEEMLVDYSHPEIYDLIPVSQQKTSGFVKGITVLGKKLYIVRQGTENLEEYDLFILEDPPNLIRIPDLKCAIDLVSCTKNMCLYISDRMGHKIYKLKLQRRALAVWPMNKRPEGLSVSNDANLIVCCRTRTIILLNTKGETLLEIELPDGITLIRHAIQRKVGEFIICHGEDTEENDVGVCVVSQDEGILKVGLIGSYKQKNKNTPSKAHLKFVTRLIATPDKCVLVLASEDGELVWLDEDLKETGRKSVSVPEDNTSRMFLDAEHQKIYCSENNKDGRIRVHEIKIKKNQ